MHKEKQTQNNHLKAKIAAFIFVITLIVVLTSTISERHAYCEKISNVRIDKNITEIVSLKNRFPTDKLNGHQYSFLYQIFSNMRLQNINFMEIGIGCGMSYGPGHSYLFWDEFLGLNEKHVIDVNCECLKKFNIPHAHCGLQSDDNLLKEFNDDFFDLIVDDGSHLAHDQINMIKKWSNKVKKNGWVVVEDSIVCDIPPYGSGYCDLLMVFVRKMITSDYKSNYCFEGVPKEVTNVIISYGITAIQFGNRCHV